MFLTFRVQTLKSLNNSVFLVMTPYTSVDTDKSTQRYITAFAVTVLDLTP